MPTTTHHIYLISDATGETVQSIARACTVQFEDVDVVEHLWPMVRSPKALEVVFEDLESEPGLVLYTLLNDDLRERLRARIRVTDVQTVRFGEIPRRLWQAEVCRSADHFRQAHRECWPDEELTDDTELVATWFELVESVLP